MHWYKIAKRNILDIYARNITNSIFSQIKQQKTRGSVRADKLPGLPKFVSDITFEIKADATTTFPFYVHGQFDLDTKFIHIRIGIKELSNQFSPKLYSDLIQEIYPAIRHELQHAYQTYIAIKNYDLGRLFRAVSTSGWNFIESTKSYLTRDHEIDAFIKGFYAVSKRRKQPLEFIIKEWLNKVIQFLIQKGIPQEEAQSVIQEVYSIWITKANQLLPQRKQYELV